jgi:hypothetical protein
MTNTAAVSLPDCWGFDTNTKLTLKTASALASSAYHDNPLTFAFRYVFFGPPRLGDLSPLETDAILTAGLRLLVVQHCRAPGWTASGQLGSSDGSWAARNARDAGYLAGCHLAMDLEGLSNSGHPVFDHAVEWCNAVRAGGYLPLIYVGYDAGLNADELWNIPNVDRYWSDFGQREVSHRGFCAKQFSQTTIAGIQVDPDHAMPDALGGTLTAMGALADVA